MDIRPDARASLVSLILVLFVAWLSLPTQDIFAAEVEINGKVFHLPDGFTIERVAGPPLVDRPITADFDEQGRLYVADSSGSNAPLKEQQKNPEHRIVRLVDADGDGRFDESTVFADKMMFPEGTMWYEGSLYVSAPPSIWKLTDTDDDGVADRREEWVQPGTLTGCGNDLHGPYLGIDGWIYWCKGAFAEQTYERPGRKPWSTTAAHIFRCRPDAPRDPATGAVRSSAIEPVMTGGMDNPVDVVFTPGGERIFTTTFLVHPGGGDRDGLIHAIYGGVYGKNRIDSLIGHPRTGELMPVLRHLGPAAPCGLTRYRSNIFGDGFQDNLFACLFNMRKVTRHVLTPQGSTFTTAPDEVEDFLICDDVDFHPTDVLEDADGSLIVVDTGGWYKLCCPTSHLEKPDVLGAIYRVKRVDAKPVADPRGNEIAWHVLSAEQLKSYLADPRPTVRDRCTFEFAGRGDEAVQTLANVIGQSKDAITRLRAVWTLTRIDGLDARSAIRNALNDADETVRQAALHSASVWRDRDAVPQVLQLLKSDSPANKRVAAEALGRLGDASAIPALLAAAGQAHDRPLEHSLTYALIELADAQATLAGLRSNNPYTHRAALFALDQMSLVDGSASHLKPDDVVPLLSSENETLTAAADWIVDQHADWAEAMVEYFRGQLRSISNATSPEKRTELQDRLTRFGAQPPAVQLLAESLTDSELSSEAKKVVLGAMASSSSKELPSVWMAPLLQLLNSEDAETLTAAIEVFRKLPLSEEIEQDQVATIRAALSAIGHDDSAPAELRLAALATLPGGLQDVSPAILEFLALHVDSEQPVSTRSAAVTVLSQARLNPDDLLAIVSVFDDVSPLEIDALIEAFARQSGSEAVGLALIAALESSPARSALRAETLEPQLKGFPAGVLRKAEHLYELLKEDTAEQRARLEFLLESMPPGDIRRGHQIFRSSKASCSACHEMGYLGGKVGPDLTRIARIRTKLDLLEAIVFPSSSLVRSYEPSVILTAAGKTHNGLIVSDTPDEIILATGPDQQVRIARDEIEEVLPSTVSVMPAGLDKQLTPQELADLVEFLLSAK